MRNMLAMLATLGVATLGFADTTANTDATTTGDCAQARKLAKPCVLEIDGEQIAGSTPRVSESAILVTRFGKHGSLIRIRRDFIPELVKSAEDL